MIIFGLSLCTLVTFAFMYKGDYVECFTDDDCITNFPENNNNYCYVGTCTYRCPPGYNQSSTGDNFKFRCECDKENGLVAEGNFTDAFANITKCKCDKPYCTVTVYATGIGYTDGLIPKGAPPNCKAVLDEIPPVLTQFSFYLVIVTMGIFFVIHCRSASSVVYDFHRYYGLYVLGSILVIVFVQTVYPFTAGFTRTMAFGIVAHNSMEWNILIRLQYGKTMHARNSGNLCLIMYFVMMLLAMSVIRRLDHLLYFCMVQGGFLDWTFVCFILAAQNTVQKSDTDPIYFHQCCKDDYARFVCWFGFGAILHLLSVEILFAGFILNNATLIGLGGFFLLPMFLFYTIWVFGQDRLMVFLGPRLFMQYEQKNVLCADKNYQITPYKHTTRVVDILWKRFVGDYGPIPMEPVQESMGIDKPRGGGGGTSGVFEVEDLESFKFGINDECCSCKCPRVPCCCNNWVPLYWIIALIFISVNAGILVQLPKWTSVKGCNAGFDYGAW